MTVLEYLNIKLTLFIHLQSFVLKRSYWDFWRRSTIFPKMTYLNNFFFTQIKNVLFIVDLKILFIFLIKIGIDISNRTSWHTQQSITSVTFRILVAIHQNLNALKSITIAARVKVNLYTRMVACTLSWNSS